MTDFVYRGIPIERGGIVIAVQPVRSIEAPNGKHYRGVLATDRRGYEFVYNQYPNTGVTPLNIWDDTAIWKDSGIWKD